MPSYESHLPSATAAPGKDPGPDWAPCAEDVYSCALARTFAYEPSTLGALLECFGSERALLQEGPFRLMEKGASPAMLRAGMAVLRARLSMDDCAFALDHACSEFPAPPAQTIRRGSPSYPDTLSSASCPPVMLFLRSFSPAGAFFRPDRRIVCITGPRFPSAYARSCLGELLKTLLPHKDKFVLLTGLSDGVELEVQRFALARGMPSLAVCCGPDGTCFPEDRRGDASRLSCSFIHGTITDVPPLTPSPKYATKTTVMHKRDTLLASLCHCVVAIESKRRYDSRLPRMAFAQGREVFAYPGRITDQDSLGCNLLIGNHIAQSVHSTSSLVKDLLAIRG